MTTQGFHWHVKVGIPGYGPDLTDADGYAGTDDADAADSVRYELSSFADFLEDGASMLAEQEDYKGAWLNHKKAEALLALRANLDPARASAPFYRDDPATRPRSTSMPSLRLPTRQARILTSRTAWRHTNSPWLTTQVRFLMPTSSRRPGRSTSWSTPATPKACPTEGKPMKSYRSIAARDAGLGVGHVWTNMHCPAYRSLDPRDCRCRKEEVRKCWTTT